MHGPGRAQNLGDLIESRPFVNKGVVPQCMLGPGLESAAHYVLILDCSGAWLQAEL